MLLNYWYFCDICVTDRLSGSLCFFLFFFRTRASTRCTDYPTWSTWSTPRYIWTPPSVFWRSPRWSRERIIKSNRTDEQHRLLKHHIHSRHIFSWQFWARIFHHGAGPFESEEMSRPLRSKKCITKSSEKTSANHSSNIISIWHHHPHHHHVTATAEVEYIPLLTLLGLFSHDFRKAFSNLRIKIASNKLFERRPPFLAEQPHIHSWNISS